MSAASDHALLMDRIYRWQRRFGIYDATRKYYLLGRDPLLAGLAPPPGGCVLEIGCGTGRNLVQAAKLYPQARFHGIDISQEMLAAAGAAISGAGLKDRVRLARADAAGFDPQVVFGQATYDRIFISYAVSMIPPWQRVMEAAVARLSPGGELHIADFGDMRELPRWCKNAVDTWLGWHHVTPRADLFDISSQLAATHGSISEERRLHRGFSWLATIRKG
ncbi:class I SAM-dependent methyltransferase [Shinella sp. CPCC 101442]|uniref:class I SAM-dependent methyltransferase n=1 Tax=Shinella sp. CPCC 101442 TaxID=2932265 RepID=UPI00215367A7|nr:class I SAM-dependent methyltransferase [Shinella sp. CPCC 101442]MCR6498342.1 class I SAM-dependent methyltransferase [Shinella sp. CPCC 101442]